MSEYHDTSLFSCQVCGKPLEEWENLDEELCSLHDPSVREDGDPVPLDLDPSGVPVFSDHDIENPYDVLDDDEAYPDLYGEEE